ncbi:hypothetical protein P7C70_g6537, partial [Phenoliferia sp. Uapishka_3]
MGVQSQFAHIHRSFTLLSHSRQALATSSYAKLQAPNKVNANDIADEKRELARIESVDQALKNDLLVQIGYLPLTMHWSLPNGLLPDQVWVGVFGTLAAACGLRGVHITIGASPLPLRTDSPIQIYPSGSNHETHLPASPTHLSSVNYHLQLATSSLSPIRQARLAYPQSLTRTQKLGSMSIPNDHPSTPPEAEPFFPLITPRRTPSPLPNSEAKTWVPLFISRNPNSPLLTATVLPPTPRREASFPGSTTGYSPPSDSSNSLNSASGSGSDDENGNTLQPWGSRRGTLVTASGIDPRAASPRLDGVGPVPRGWSAPGNNGGRTSGVDQRGHVRKRSSQSVVSAMPGLGVAIPGMSDRLIGMERKHSLTSFMQQERKNDAHNNGGYATMDQRRPSHASKYRKQLADEKAKVWMIACRSTVAFLALCLFVACVNLVFSYGLLPPSTTDLLPPAWLDSMVPDSIHGALTLIETVPFSTKSHPRTPHSDDDITLANYLTTRLGSHFSVPLANTPAHLWLSPATNTSIRITTPHLHSFLGNLDFLAETHNTPILASDAYQAQLSPRRKTLAAFANSIYAPVQELKEQKKRRGEGLLPRRTLVTLCMDEGCLEYCRDNQELYCFGGLAVEGMRGARMSKAREMIKMMAAVETLLSGRRVFIADGDVYFRDDPLSSMGDLDDFDIQIPDSWSTSHTKAGFVFLNPTANVISLWERLLQLSRVDDDLESRSWATTNLLLDPMGLNRQVAPEAKDKKSTEDEEDDAVPSGYGQTEFESPWAGGMDVKILDRKRFRTSTGKLEGNAWGRAEAGKAIYFQCKCCEDIATTDYIAGALGYHQPSIAFPSPRSQGGVPHFPMMLTTPLLNGTSADLAFSIGLLLQTAHDTSRSFVPPLKGHLLSTGVDYSDVTTSNETIFIPNKTVEIERYIWRLFPASTWARGFLSSSTASAPIHLSAPVLEPLYISHALSYLGTIHRHSEIAKSSTADLKETLVIDPSDFQTYKEYLQTVIRPFYGTTRVVVVEGMEKVRGRKGWELRDEFAGVTSCEAPEEEVEGRCGKTSNCQTVQMNNLNDFCLWGLTPLPSLSASPPTPGQSIGDSEREEVAWCTQSGHGTRVMPAGTIQGAHWPGDYSAGSFDSCDGDSVEYPGVYVNNGVT